MIDSLWRYGAQVNLKGKGGRTPLAVAATHGHKDAIDILLRADARFDTRDNENNTPFLLAAQHGHANVVNYFLQHPGNYIKIEDSDRQGNTALIQAAARGHGEVSKILLQYGVDIYHTNCLGQTACDVARGSARLIVWERKDKCDKECADIEKLQNNIALLERQSGSGIRVPTYTRRKLQEMHSQTRQQNIRELQRINNRLVQEAEKFKQKAENEEQMERECRSILRRQQGIKTLDDDNQKLDRELRQHPQHAAENHYQVYDGRQLSKEKLQTMDSSQRKQMIQRLSQVKEKKQQEKIKCEEKLKKIKQVQQPAGAQEELDDEEECFICCKNIGKKIPCKNSHPDKICLSCIMNPKLEKCPLCREKLEKT